MPVDYSRSLDPAELLRALGYEDDFDSPAKIRARAAALRGDPANYGQESAAGMGGMMLRGPTAGRISNALYTSGERGKRDFADQADSETTRAGETRKAALSQTIANMRDKRASEAAAAAAERDEYWKQKDYGLRAASEARQAAQSGREEWSAIADPISGEIMLYNKRTGERKQPDGGGMAPQGGPNVGPRADGSGLQRPTMLPGATGGLSPYAPPTGKPPTEAASKSGMRGGVITESLGNVEQAVRRTPSAAKPGIVETAGTVMGLNPEVQQLLAQASGGVDRGLVRGAQEGGIDAALTEMTGAAYTAPQLATYRAQFMPTILDNPASIQEKKMRFAEFVRQQSIAAGRAWTPEREQRLQEVVSEIMVAPQDAPEGRPGDRYLRGG